MTHTQCVIWDWNGTLLDDAKVSHQIFNQLLKKKGFDALSFDSYQEIYTHPIVAMYETAGFVFNDEYSFESLSEEWYQIYAETHHLLSLFPDVLPVLDALSGRGLRQIVISALHHETLLTQAKKFNVHHYFDEISGHHDLRADGKIDRAVTLCKTLGVSPQSATVIGDTSHDAEMAKEIGCNCILISRGYEPHERLLQHGFTVLDADAFLTVPMLL